MEALLAAGAVFGDGADASDEFSVDDEITLIFFSEVIGGELPHLHKVEQRRNKIEVQYQLEPLFDRHRSFAFALIPLGKLPVGEYRVEMRQLPREKRFAKLSAKPLNEEWSRRFLCKPFSFSVTRRDE